MLIVDWERLGFWWVGVGGAYPCCLQFELRAICYSSRRKLEELGIEPGECLQARTGIKDIFVNISSLYVGLEDEGV